MKRRDFCKALALSAAALAVPRAAAENTQGAVGRAVADGRYSMRFRSELSLTDVPHDYYYSDSFFAHSALEYDHSLALASLGLVGAAFNTAASDARYWANGEVGREANLADAFATLGFAEIVRAFFQWNALGPLTNGSNLLKSYPDLGGASSYLILIGIFIATILLLVNSTYGRAFKAIRDDEIAAEAMGINLAHHKRLAFIISSFFAGVGGGMLAMYMGTVQALSFKSTMTYEIPVSYTHLTLPTKRIV